MAAINYVALIHKDKGSEFGVSFPDFPGCISSGATLDEARAMAREALAVHIEAMEESGLNIPDPSALDAIMHERENRDAVAVLIEAPAVKAKAERVTITMAKDLLESAKESADKLGMTFSGFLAEGVRRMVGRGPAASKTRGVLYGRGRKQRNRRASKASRRKSGRQSKT